MEAKIVCYFGNQNGNPLTRVFTVDDNELAKTQICYFDRFIKSFEATCQKLVDSFKMATLETIHVVVSCHGYNHTYKYNNGKLVKNV